MSRKTALVCAAILMAFAHLFAQKPKLPRADVPDVFAPPPASGPNLIVLSEKTSTDTGLSIEVTINNRNYTAERKYSEEFKTNINNYIVFDEKSPKWNYSVLHKPL